MENNIYFSNISKSFDGKIVLDNLSHGFKLNQVHVILGKSGMGKSVLLKMLMGLMKPDSGKILINQNFLRFSVFCVIEFFDRD